jgi:putative two-component system response regulator
LLALSKAQQALQNHAIEFTREVTAAVALVEEREREIISTLTRAADSRDTDTSDHIARVSAYSFDKLMKAELPGRQVGSIAT